LLFPKVSLNRDVSHFTIATLPENAQPRVDDWRRLPIAINELRIPVDPRRTNNPLRGKHLETSAPAREG
jgi:hypothetical protein